MRAWFAIFALAFLTASAAGQTTLDRRQTGIISTQTPRVSFEVQMDAGQIVTLTTSSAQNVDTILTLNDPSGRRVAENDDQQAGVLSSRIVYRARTGGRHTAIVSGYNGAIGAFELNIVHGVDVGLSPAARSLREETLSFDRQRTERRFPIDLRDDEVFVASTLALSDDLDTTLKLLDANGVILAQNDDRGDGSLNSQLVYRTARAGRYELVASTYSGDGIGEFVLSLALDPNAQAPFNFASIDGAPIAHYEGELNDEQPRRDYNVRLAPGQTLLAVSDATSGNLDTVLRLQGPDGFPVALNDDRGDGSLNSGFAFTAQTAGTYRLELYRFEQSRSSGAFRLALSSVDRSVVATLQALTENPMTLSGAEQTIETPDFRVHYTLEGRDAATEPYARATAAALQNAYDVQVTRLGWAAPVRDPDGRYRAYIADANGDMGYTKSVQIVFDNPNTARVRETGAARPMLVIENDFRGMGKRASAESLMRATVEHEFNHAIQYGYDAQEGLNWLFESTASWMETRAAGADQDATQYVETDFAAPELCWTTTARGHNYAQWTLLQSLADSYGDRIVTQLWENSVAFDGFETMSRTLTGVGTTTPDVIRRWRVQNFARDYALAPQFTGSVRLAGTIARNGAWSTKGGVEQLGAHYVALRLQGRHSFTLRGGNDLELIGLGLRNGRIEIVPLGGSGVFDTSSYTYSALMVFNRAMPATPGACASADYSIDVAAAATAMASPQYSVSAAHFTPPS